MLTDGQDVLVITDLGSTASTKCSITNRWREGGEGKERMREGRGRREKGKGGREGDEKGEEGGKEGRRGRKKEGGRVGDQKLCDCSFICQTGSFGLAGVLCPDLHCSL